MTYKQRVEQNLSQLNERFPLLKLKLRKSIVVGRGKRPIQLWAVDSDNPWLQDGGLPIKDIYRWLIGVDDMSRAFETI